MNTMNTSATLRRLMAIAMVSAVTANFAVLARAADSDAPQITVKYGELNVSTPQGVAEQYRRIHVAAERVCGSFDGRDLASKAHRDTCVHDAIAGAIQKAANPVLQALYDDKNGKPANIIVASGQRGEWP